MNEHETPYDEEETTAKQIGIIGPIQKVWAKQEGYRRCLNDLAAGTAPGTEQDARVEKLVEAAKAEYHSYVPTGGFCMRCEAHGKPPLEHKPSCKSGRLQAALEPWKGA